jgi:reactive intermediate/imine deaminase
MDKKKINSSRFASRLGAYSHGYAVDVGDATLIFTTGQIALDAEGKVVAPGDAERQAEFVFEALQSILREAGASLDDAVKATTYVTNMADFPKISAVRNKYFKNSEPVSTLVEVSKLVKDGCVVEIEVVAVRNNRQ